MQPLRLAVLSRHPIRALLFNFSIAQLEKHFGICAYEINEHKVNNILLSADEDTMKKYITQLHYNENVLRD